MNPSDDDGGEDSAGEIDLESALSELRERKANAAARQVKHKRVIVERCHRAIAVRDACELRTHLQTCTSQHVLGKYDLQVLGDVLRDIEGDQNVELCLRNPLVLGQPGQSVADPPGFSSGMFVQRLQSGVVRLPTGHFAVHIPKMLPFSASPTFQQPEHAAAFHDSIVLMKDDLREHPANYMNAAGSHLERASLNDLYERRLSNHMAQCVEKGLRFDQIYLKVPKDDVMIKRSGVPFHQSTDDHIRDIGRDFTGQNSWVAVGSLGKKFDTGVTVPNVVAELFKRKPVGIGVRNYALDRAQWKDLHTTLDIDVPSELRSVCASLHVFSAPWDTKQVSPLLQDGVFTLAICGTQCRQALRKREDQLRCVIVLRNQLIKAIFLVGCLLPATSYHVDGLRDARLVPKRGKKRRSS